MTRLVAVAAALLFSASAQAQQYAQPTGGNTYVSARLGAFAPQDEDIEYLDNGLEGEVAIGWYLNPSVAAELGVGFFNASGDVSWYDDYYGGVLSSKDTLRVVPFTGTIRLLAPIDRLTFSALAGVGLYQVRMESEITDGYDTASFSDTDSTFGFHLGAGAALELSPTTSLGVDLRYVVAKAELFDLDYALNGLRMGAALAFRF
jgi:opacity protein-like surface antigen